MGRQVMDCSRDRGCSILEHHHWKYPISLNQYKRRHVPTTPNESVAAGFDLDEYYSKIHVLCLLIPSKNRYCRRCLRGES